MSEYTKLSELNKKTTGIADELDKLVDNEVAQVKQRRKRRTKAEIEAGTEFMKPAFTSEQVSIITKGILLTLQGVTKLPFAKTDKELQDQFAASGAMALNAYLPENYVKYYPAIQASLCLALLTMQAYDIKLKEKKTTDVQAS